MKSPLAVSLITVGIMTMSACSGTEKPAVSKLEQGLTASGNSGAIFSAKQARCVAKIYRDSDLSSDYLESVARGNPKPTADDLNELAEVGRRTAEKCDP